MTLLRFCCSLFALLISLPGLNFTEKAHSDVDDVTNTPATYYPLYDSFQLNDTVAFEFYGYCIYERLEFLYRNEQ